MAPEVVPDARGDDTVAPRDAAHLGQPRDGVLHEVDDQLRQGRVKRPVSERQPLGRRPADVDARIARPRRGHERLGRIRGSHPGRPQPLDQLARQCARAAPDVEHPLPSADGGEVRHLTGQGA